MATTPWTCGIYYIVILTIFGPQKAETPRTDNQTNFQQFSGDVNPITGFKKEINR